MNLLQLLLGSLTSDNSVNSLAKKTGISSKLVSKLIVMAVPLLIKYMTKNASTASGAQSLLSALTKHNGTRAMSEQIDDVDEEDGAKIIGHILGNDQEKVVTTLAKETGLQNNEVSRGLGALAPALLTGLAAATTASKPGSGGMDLGSLMSMFGGNQNTATSSLNMLGSLLGATQPQQQQQPTSLLGSLFGGNKPQQQVQQQPTSLLSGFFGGNQQAQPVQQQAQGVDLNSLMGLLGGGQQPTQSSIDGSDLLSALTALMK